MIYRLKQSSQEWNIKLNKELERLEFHQLYSDPCAYIKRSKNRIEIITVWVDNMLLFTNSEKLMTNLKQKLQEMFKVTDLGEPSQIVRIEIQ